MWHDGQFPKSHCRLGARRQYLLLLLRFVPQIVIPATVNKNLWLMSGVFAALLAVNVSLGGCISSGSEKPARLQEKIEDARTRADHEELAGYYEQEANALQAKAKQHEQNAKASGPPTGYARLKDSFARHCHYLANKYRDDTETNLALAKLHRRMAAESP